MTRITGPDCVVRCNLIHTYTYMHKYIHTYIYIHTDIHTFTVPGGRFRISREITVSIQVENLRIRRDFRHMRREITDVINVENLRIG